MVATSIKKTHNPVAMRREAVAEWVVERFFERHPELGTKWGLVGRVRALEDVVYHVTYLATALGLDRVEFFTDYIDWTRSVLEAHGVSSATLGESLELTKEKLIVDFADDQALVSKIADFFGHAQQRLDLEAPPAGAAPSSDHPLESTAREYLDLLLDAKRRQSKDLLDSVIQSGVDIKDVYIHIIARSQQLLGVLWQEGRISVAKEHYVTAATQANITSLYPYVFTQKPPSKGKSMVGTCVSGELHELGIRMVTDFFEMDGWDTSYLGANTPTPDLLAYLKELSPDILALSATISPHVEHVAELIAHVRAQKELGSLRILVGGHPFNRAEGLWKQIGADAMAVDAKSAVQAGCELVREELTRINSEQASALRSQVKGTLKSSAGASSDEIDALEQFTQLNNDLSNTQRELHKTNAKLARLNEEKNLAIGMLAHDLRNPLSAVISYSRLLLDHLHDVGFEEREMLEIIHSSSDFMRRLIDDILDVSKIEAGKLILDLQPSSVFALIERCVSLSRLAADQKNISVRLELPKTVEPPVLEIDPVKIEQVLTNLISNALKFSPLGSKVAVRAEVTPKVVTVSVCDEGPGIPKDKIDRLFLPFSTVGSRPTGQENSTGLGLAIARRIVDGHGGRLDVRSNVGRGSTFTFTLPREASIQRKAEKRTSMMSNNPSITSAQSARVLLAEDNHTNRKVAHKLLERLGCAVTSVENGKELLDAWSRDERFDLIITDVEMPELGGVEATEIIRRKEREEARPKTPIIGLTAHNDSHNRAACRQAGMDDVITKPIDTRLLRKLVDGFSTA